MWNSSGIRTQPNWWFWVTAKPGSIFYRIAFIISFTCQQPLFKCVSPRYFPTSSDILQQLPPAEERELSVWQLPIYKMEGELVGIVLWLRRMWCHFIQWLCHCHQVCYSCCSTWRQFWPAEIMFPRTVNYIRSMFTRTGSSPICVGVCPAGFVH